MSLLEEEEALDEGKVYDWEKKYVGSWVNVLEDEKGAIKSAGRHASRRQRRDSEMGTIKRGMRRHLFLIVDMSRAMDDNDLRPNRLQVTLRIVSNFIKEFYDQNPISQMGLIITRKGIAEKLTELSGNPKRHIQELQKHAHTAGEASIQNALEVAKSTLRHVPKYGSREVLIVLSALTVCDPGDIFATIKELKKENIRCSVVGLSAEMYVCRKLVQETSGQYSIVKNEDHFQEMMHLHLPPPPLPPTRMDASLILMGFPQQFTDRETSLCVCHRKLQYGGYLCPQCKCKYCELPTDCKICGLTLVLSPHLARSYHHLFPVPSFDEKNASNREELCFACLSRIQERMYNCPKCQKYFCLECDIFIHESLHNCPGCEANN